MTKDAVSEISGTVARGFEGCRDAFARGLDSGAEIGAACSIRVNGRTVVDLWGGIADNSNGRAWARDTIVPVFSVSKGIAAICVLHLVAQGQLELDAPIARYWPEFGQHGKSEVTIRQALAHRAGVPYIDGDISLHDLADDEGMAARLAAQSPVFKPGSAHLYHPVTVGWITGELIRRVTGVSIGQWLASNVARALDIPLHFGLPDSEQRKVAKLAYRDPAQARVGLAAFAPGSLPWSALTLNGALSFDPEFGDGSLNDPRVQALQLAGAGLVTNARALSKVYAACLAPVEGLRLLSDQVIAEAIRPVSTGEQFGIPEKGPSWGAGLMIPWSVQPMFGGTGFGHDGMGGSLAFASPERQVSFAYVRNGMATNGIRDPEVYAVVDALADILNAAGGT